jgi:hypothetical protein
MAYAAAAANNAVNPWTCHAKHWCCHVVSAAFLFVITV